MTRTGEGNGVPGDVATLGGWLALDPPAHLGDLERRVLGAADDELGAVLLAARIGLKWAWDAAPEQFFPLLQPWARSDQVRLRLLAASAAPVAHERYQAESAALLQELARDPDPAVRRAAIDLLAEQPEDLPAEVARWARDEDPKVRALVARHLRQVRPERPAGIKLALELLDHLALDPEPDVHWAAAATLRELYEVEPRGTLELVRKMASSRDPAVRWAAAAGFLEHVLPDQLELLLPPVRAWLKSGDEGVRWTVVRSLRFVKASARAVGLLKLLFEMDDADVRRQATLQLVELFEPGQEMHRVIAEVLRRAREDPSPGVAEAACDGELRRGVTWASIPLPGQELPAEPEYAEGGDDEGEEEEEDES